MPPLTLMSSMATKALLAELVAPQALPGLGAVELVSLGGVEVLRRIRGGEAEADLVLLAAGAIEGLRQDGYVVPDTVRPLFRSEAVLAIREGVPAPDISTGDALRETLLSADGIAYSTGPSGDGLLALLDDWGIRSAVADRLVQAEPGVPVGRLLAEGRAAVGIQQRSELERAPGVSVLGPLPSGCEIQTVFAGAVLAQSRNAAAATACLERLSRPDVGTIAHRHGMELVDAPGDT